MSSAEEEKEKLLHVPYLHSTFLITSSVYHLLPGVLLDPDVLVTFTTQLPWAAE